MSIAKIMMSDDVYDLEITFKGTENLHTQLSVLLTQCIAQICGESNGNTYEFCMKDVNDKVLSRVKKAFLKAGIFNCRRDDSRIKKVSKILRFPF